MARCISAVLLVVVLLGGCAGGQVEPTATHDAQIDRLVSEWGGDEDRYRGIFAMRDCAQLEALMQATARAIDAAEFGSDAQRAEIGYSQALLMRRIDLGC